MKAVTQVSISFTAGLMALTPLMLLKEKTPLARDVNFEAPVNLNEPEVTSWAIKHIGAVEAWNKERGSKNIIVAVIDTGADIHHPALAPSLWHNPGESGRDADGFDKSTNGIDDDGNGFADDVHGWNFITDSPEVMDEHGHGTHIAGVIAGHGVGVAPDVSLMILKYYDTESSGMDNLKHTVRALYYAVAMGAHIINYSGGGIFKSQEEEAALAWAQRQGVLVVAAAGNEGVNSDFHPFYPADYDLDNIISVGASDNEGRLLTISNFGLESVDLAAPGKNVYSTLPGGGYGLMTGTSQATALTTGVAALLMSHNPALARDTASVAGNLKISGTKLSSLARTTGSGRLLNAAAALKMAETELAAQ